MSNIDRTLQILPQTGMDLRSLDKSSGSPFIQNVMPRNGGSVCANSGCPYHQGTVCGRRL